MKINALSAPLKKGDIVGTLYIKEDDTVTREIPITIEKDVDKANIFQLYVRYLKEVFLGDSI